MEQNKKAEAILIVIKRIAKWVLLSVLGLATLALVVGLGVSLYDKWEDRAKVVSELKGIALGEKLNDVLFKNPGLKLSDWSTKVKALESSIEYGNDEDKVWVHFLDDKVIAVNYSCNDNYDYTSINGISCGYTSEDIVEKYGGKVRVLCNAKLKIAGRAYDIVENGIRYILHYNKVVAFSVNKPEYLKTFVGYNWRNCD
jgi:hypothetical protein